MENLFLITTREMQCSFSVFAQKASSSVFYSYDLPYLTFSRFNLTFTEVTREWISYISKQICRSNIIFIEVIEIEMTLGHAMNWNERHEMLDRIYHYLLVSLPRTDYSFVHVISELYYRMFLYQRKRVRQSLLHILFPILVWMRNLSMCK